MKKSIMNLIILQK